MRTSRNQASYLFDVVKRTIDLKGFVERECGSTLAADGQNRWKSICPLHKDSKASFSVRLKESGIWVYNCFGCNSGGTIVDFCMVLHSIPTSYEAAVFAAQKEGIKCDENLISMAIREANVREDEQRETDIAHFIACQNCRRLLRTCKGDEEMFAWVALTYKAMNKLLDDPKTIKTSFDGFRVESCRRLSELAKRK